MMRFLLAIGVFAAHLVASAALATYSFEGTTAPNPGTAPHLTASSLTRGAGLTVPAAGDYASGVGGGQSFISLSWPTNSAYSAASTDYLSILLTPAPGYQISISQVSFDLLRSGSGPTNWFLSTGADAFAVPVAKGTLPTAPPNTFLHFSGSVNQVSDGAVEIRLYATRASSALGALRIDNLVVDGTMIQVPEPAGAAALAGIIACLWAAGRRRV